MRFDRLFKARLGLAVALALASTLLMLTATGPAQAADGNTLAGLMDRLALAPKTATEANAQRPAEKALGQTLIQQADDYVRAFQAPMPGGTTAPADPAAAMRNAQQMQAQLGDLDDAKVAQMSNAEKMALAMKLAQMQRTSMGPPPVAVPLTDADHATFEQIDQHNHLIVDFTRQLNGMAGPWQQALDAWNAADARIDSEFTEAVKRIPATGPEIGEMGRALDPAGVKAVATQFGTRHAQQAQKALPQLADLWNQQRKIYLQWARLLDDDRMRVARVLNPQVKRQATQLMQAKLPPPHMASPVEVIDGLYERAARALADDRRNLQRLGL